MSAKDASSDAISCGHEDCMRVQHESMCVSVHLSVYVVSGEGVCAYVYILHAYYDNREHEYIYQISLCASHAPVIPICEMCVFSNVCLDLLWCNIFFSPWPRALFLWRSCLVSNIWARCRVKRHGPFCRRTMCWAAARRGICTCATT